MNTPRELAPLETNMARCAALLGLDALATTVGLYLALLIDVGEGAPGLVASTFRAAILPLVGLRLATTMMARLHAWSFLRNGHLDSARLILTCMVGSLAFWFVFPSLPRSTYLLECFFSANLMALPRFGPALIWEYDRQRFPEPVVRFLTAERPRRAVNVVVAVFGLLLTLPLWALIAAAIKLTSRGPVFYMQERVGLDLRHTMPDLNDPRRLRDLGGRPFLMYKFRTMCTEAETGTGAVWCAKDDPRVTRIGKFLRHYRLDELPQLLNVIKGDMNVVGPRPERASIFAVLRERIPGYSVRQRTRPGITGFAQVHLEYDATVDDVREKLRYDTEYLAQQCVGMDLQIMARTLPVMLFRKRFLAQQRTADARMPGGPVLHPEESAK